MTIEKWYRIRRNFWMTKFSKKVGCQQFRKHYFWKWSKGLASRSWSFSYFEILFSKTLHSFRNFRKFCHSKISTYTVADNGWVIVKAYDNDKLASDSEDEKHLEGSRAGDF